METIKAAIGLVPADSTEPVAGTTNDGHAPEPYDAGNSDAANAAAAKERAAEEVETGAKDGEEGGQTLVGAVIESIVGTFRGSPEEAEAGTETGEKAVEHDAEHKAESTEPAANAEEKKDEAAADTKDEQTESHVQGSDKPGAPKENPEAIPTAGGEPVGSQPVQERIEADEAPSPATEKAGLNREATTDADGAPKTMETVAAAPGSAAAATPDAAPPVASTETPTAPTAAAADAPSNSTEPAAKAAPAADAMQKPAGAPASAPATTDKSGLQRKPSKLSRLMNKIRGKKAKADDAIAEQK